MILRMNFLRVKKRHQHLFNIIGTVVPLATAAESSTSKGIICVFSSLYLHETEVS